MMYWSLRINAHYCYVTGDYGLPSKIYSNITVAQTTLDDPERAPQEIDRVLSVCLTRQSPVYISLPAYFPS